MFCIESKTKEWVVEKLANGDLDFSYISLIYVDLSGLNFRGANFNESNLYGCRFNGCDCSGASFRGTNLNCAYFKDANLKNCDFSVLKSHERDKNRIIGAELGRMYDKRTTASHSKFDRSNMFGANMSGVELDYTSFDGANLEWDTPITACKIGFICDFDNTILERKRK